MCCCNSGGAIAGLTGNGGLELWIGGRETYNLDTPPLIAGALSFGTADYKPKKVYFRAVAARGDTVNAEVELFNLTDASSVATLTFSSTSPAMQEVQVTLPAGAKIYECRIQLAAAPGVNDTVELYSAGLRLTF